MATQIKRVKAGRYEGCGAVIERIADPSGAPHVRSRGFWLMTREGKTHEFPSLSCAKAFLGICDDCAKAKFACKRHMVEYQKRNELSSER